MITATALAVGSLTAERSGSGSAVITVLRNAGAALGPAVLGTVAITRYHDRLGALGTSPIRDSVIAGVSTARHLHDTAMLTHIQSAYISGMSLLLAISAGICALSMGSSPSLANTPRRTRPRDPSRNPRPRRSAPEHRHC